MKLKKLILQGYKTFASKTEFVFDDGITAVVGPNGSGKSNVADALRWVLGEQSFSALRGKRSTDMIFAGSQSRARAGMAQAILTLDNADNWLPIEYSEVEIGRRVHRSGESEYILNGQKVRLKDIADLLATSGLAERTYTIIGQGLIDQALSLRAEERRALFEEAAGINHYKSKRAETLRRLEETQRNLQRVHDILAEIEPRLASLKRQASRARNYEQIAADLRNLLRFWYGFKWEQAKKEMRRVRETAVSAEQAWQNARRTLLAQQHKVDGLRRQMHQLQQQVNDSQASRDSLREQMGKNQREVAILSERQQALERQLADIAQELPGLEQQQGTAQAELLAATAELEAAQASLNADQTQLQHFNLTFQTQQQEIGRWQAALKQAETEFQQGQKRLAQAEGQYSVWRTQFTNMTQPSTTADLPPEVVTLRAEVERLTAVWQSAQQVQQELHQKRSEANELRLAVIRELKPLRQRVSEQETAVNKQRNELARLETRVELLTQLRQKTLNLPTGIRSMGVLSELLTIPPAYQTAVAAALAHRLTMVVLPDETTLWQLLNSKNKTSVTAVALSRLLPPAPLEKPADAAVVGWASEVVTYNPAFQPLVQTVLGRVLLVKETETAYRLAHQLPPGCLVVTLAGFVAEVDGVVRQQNQQGAQDSLAREVELGKTADELKRVQAEINERETAVVAQQTMIQEKQTQSDELQNEERRLGRLEQEASQRVSQAQRQLDQAKQQLMFWQRQQEAQQQEAKRLQERLQLLENQIVLEKETVVKWETAVSTAHTSLQALPVAEAQQQRQSLQQQITTTRTIVAGRQAVVDSRRSTLQQVERQLNRLREQQSALQKQQQSSDLAAANSELQRLQQTLSHLEETFAPLQSSLNKARQEMATVEEETAVWQKRAHDLETHFTQGRIALSQHKNELEGLQERIKADLGLVALTYDEDQTGPTPLPMTDVVEALPQVTELPPDIEENIHHHRGQLQRMGAINPDAPAEYETTQTRFDFMTRQVKDLSETDQQLRQVIAELDKLTSQAFGETVEKVNAVFGPTFERLFGGGAARLVLTDPDNLTISGVDIIARLPNRREQGLGLLSGGERSLTAVALIFSLLKVSPTPFCVLDEVDAALDEANINRFRDLLQELSQQTQFIVITHNRGTVQTAQTVYGISMAADSASQAISIRPEEYVNGG